MTVNFEVLRNLGVKENERIKDSHCIGFSITHHKLNLEISNIYIDFMLF